MKVIEKLKKIPKKRLIIVSVLTLLIAATVIITFAVANRKNDPSPDSSGGSDPDSISVFKSSADTSAEQSEKKSTDTVEPLDLTGVNGLKYTSQGNGTCYVTGLGTCEESELKIPAYSPSGDKVVRIHDGAFANCTGLLTVTVPATVKEIGTGAFRGCSSLVAINVDTENTVYSSVGGVLLTKDKTVIVCFPMNRPGSNYLLSTDIKAVAAYAFEGAINLRGILFEGSISDFQKINFLMGNGIIDEVAITCNYVAAK